MNLYKIDDNVPLPEDILPEEEPSRWVPFKPNMARCRNGKCVPEIGRCSTCGNMFPCPSGNCGHFDCADPSIVGLDCPGNGTETPDYVIMSESVARHSRSGETPLPEEGSEQG